MRIAFTVLANTELRNTVTKSISPGNFNILPILIKKGKNCDS